MKLLSRLIISMLLIAYVSQVNASLLLTCKTPQHTNSTPVLLSDNPQLTAHNPTTQPSHLNCEMADCHSNPLAVPTNISASNILAVNHKTIHLMAYWRAPAQSSQFRPPIS